MKIVKFQAKPCIHAKIVSLLHAKNTVPTGNKWHNWIFVYFQQYHSTCNAGSHGQVRRLLKHLRNACVPMTKSVFQFFLAAGSDVVRGTTLW